MTTRITKYAVAISTAHLSVCIVYLLGYTVGFGQRLIYLTSPSDIFRVSLADLSYIYANSALLLFITARNITSKVPYLEDKINLIQDRERKYTKLGNLHKTRRIFKFFVFSYILINLAAAVYCIFTNSVLAPIFFSAIPLILVPFSQNFVMERFQIDHRVYEIASFLLFIIITAFANGILFGKSDVQVKYKDILHNSFHCNNYAIIRSISDNYVAVSIEDNKVLIDKECKLLFSF